MRFQPTGVAEATELAEWPGDLVGATPDGRTLYEMRVDDQGNRLVLHDARTGAVTKVIPIETEAQVRAIAVHPDGKRMAVSIQDSGYDLWMLEGFPVPAVGWERMFRKWVYPPESGR